MILKKILFSILLLFFFYSDVFAYVWDSQNLQQLKQALSDKELNYSHRDYGQKELNTYIEQLNFNLLDESQKIELNTLATNIFLSFAKDISVGRIDEALFQTLLKADEDSGLVWESKKKKYFYEKDLNLALKTHLVLALLYRYQPQEKAYSDLIDAYHKYENLTFSSIDYRKDLKEGDYGYEITQLKKYLCETKDLNQCDSTYINFPTFDSVLKKAVLAFQKRHYLKQDGIFNRVNALYAKRSAKDKLSQIALNIERFKLFAPANSDQYIVINIPGFSLQYFEKKTLIKDIFVVIGREDRPTPIFKDYLEYIVLNPTWSIPQHLMKKDYIRHLVENPESLLEDDIHIYQRGKEIDPKKVHWEKYLDYEGNIPYQMIQKAGEKNVLGEMKFIFPNKYNVYLHDTNAKHLTTKRYRLYSSGCIRLSDPYMLLSLLAPDTKYSYEALVNMIEEKKTRTIRLMKKIPIHIRYLTVFADKEGKVNFRKDFYGFDKIQRQALRK